MQSARDFLFELINVSQMKISPGGESAELETFSNTRFNLLPESWHNKVCDPRDYCHRLFAYLDTTLKLCMYHCFKHNTTLSVCVNIDISAVHGIFIILLIVQLFCEFMIIIPPSVDVEVREIALDFQESPSFNRLPQWGTGISSCFWLSSNITVCLAATVSPITKSGMEEAVRDKPQTQGGGRRDPT